MVSWITLIGRLVGYSDEYPSVQEDLHLLQGLAARADSDEVRPLRKEELSPKIPHCILDLARLADEVLDRGIAEGRIPRLETTWTEGAFGTSSA